MTVENKKGRFGKFGGQYVPEIVMPLPMLESVTIEAVAAEGKCIFHHGEQVVFVPFCVPGDVADVQIVKKKHRYCEGRVVRLVTPSPVRATPRCEHFGICGGCKWQNLPRSCRTLP